MKIIKGESLTIALIINDDYDLSRMSALKIFVGATSYETIFDVDKFVCKLSSNDTNNKGVGEFNVTLFLDDTTLGVQKPVLGIIEIEKTSANVGNDSKNSLYDVIYHISITHEAIEVDSVMYNFMKGDTGERGEKGDTGDSAFQVWQSQPGNEGKNYEEYIAYLREPMTAAIAEGEQTAAEWAVEEAERVANELVREQNEEDRNAAEIIREQVKDATIIAKDAAIQASIEANEAATYASDHGDYADLKATLATEKATLANDAATNANSKADLAVIATGNANAAADLANSKAGLANAAATNANDKAVLANTAAMNANTVATNVANAEAARVAAGSEVKTNMSTNIETDKASTTKYPQLKALYDWTVGRFLTMTQTTAQTIGATGARLLKLWATDIESTNMPTVGGVSLATTFAAKTQEAWMTPTLLNGATFDATDPLRYRLNQNRRVEFKGKINVIVVGQAFLLPAGYRSSIPSSRYLQLAHGAVSSLAIIQSGYVYLAIGTFDFFGTTFTID